MSSLMRGEWAAIRRAAVEAVESFGLRAVAAETTGASDESSRRTLLDQIGRCDALLLLLGGEYGTPGARGRSPVEEEFDEAVRLGIPVLALVQEGVQREPAQQAFVARVRGSWEQGRYAPGFTGAGDVGMAVVRALRSLTEAGPSQERVRQAASRALDLAAEQERYHLQVPRVHLIAVPVLGRPLIDALQLQSDELADELATRARRVGLVPNSLGIVTDVRSDGIHLKVGDGPRLRLCVGMDGAVLGDGDVAGTGMLGGSVLLADRVLDVLDRSARFALATWDLVDRRDEVRHAQLVVAVPGSCSRVYATTAPGNSLAMGNMFGVDLIVVPEPPLLVRREDVARPDTLERLRAGDPSPFRAGGRAARPQ